MTRSKQHVEHRFGLSPFAPQRVAGSIGRMRRILKRAVEMNLPPHAVLSPAMPAAQGGGEGTDESARRLTVIFKRHVRGAVSAVLSLLLVNCCAGQSYLVDAHWDPWSESVANLEAIRTIPRWEPRRLPPTDPTVSFHRNWESTNESTGSIWDDAVGPEEFLFEERLSESDVKDDRKPGLLGTLFEDQQEFYSRKNLGHVAIVLGIAGVMANTNIDRFVTFDLYHENVRNANTDEWLEHLHKPKFFGDAYYAIPVYGAACLSSKLLPTETTQTIGDWGGRSLRTLIVGGPPLLLTQQFTGGSRPGERDHGSHWQPFQDDNGASGHSFVGAVPFLSAAYLTEDRFLRGGLIAASTLPAISRLNDDAHYASQVALGWSLAFFAANAVNATEINRHPLSLGMTTLNGTPQMAISYEW